jgi:ribulose-phosphate 3-epimerase
MSELRSRASKTLATLRAARPAILPSLLLCDFANLEREVHALEEAGVECLHLDVMDGHFVPNMSYGMPIVESIRKITDLVLDVHLMISNPNQYAKQFVDAGADSMTFHIEAVPHPTDLLSELKHLDIAVGLAINPSTDFQCLLPFVSECDLVLTMSVEAGFGGQDFNPIALERIRTLRKSFGPELLLEVDGGVNEKSIGLCTSHGADLLVVGSALFRQADYCQAMTRLMSAMQPLGSA